METWAIQIRGNLRFKACSITTAKFDLIENLQV